MSSIIEVSIDHLHVNIRLCVKYGGVRSVCMETKALPRTTGVEPLVKRPSLPTPWEDRDSSSHPLAVFRFIRSTSSLSPPWGRRFRFHAVIRIIPKCALKYVLPGSAPVCPQKIVSARWVVQYSPSWMSHWKSAYVPYFSNLWSLFQVTLYRNSRLLSYNESRNRLTPIPILSNWNERRAPKAKIICPSGVCILIKYSIS